MDVPGRLTDPDARTARTDHRSPALKADPFSQLKLLDVQELDSRLDQLAHQRATLPENKELAALGAERAEADSAARDTRISVDDLTREQKRADADVEQVKTRRKRDQERMDQGLITNPKDLERMQHELVSLERRISDLEDVELEIMARLEDAQKDLDRHTARLGELDTRATELTELRDEKAAAIDAEVAEVTTKRAAAVEGLPEDLLALYERLRASKGGVGAAPLHARRCEGCRMQINASDLGVIAKAPTDEVIRCEECQRILVRTSESGI